MQEQLNEEFLHELFKCSITKKSFLDTLIPILKINYLPDENYQKVWKEISDLYQSGEAKTLPTIGVLSESLKKDKNCLKIVGKMRRIVDLDYDGVTRALEEYVKQNMFVEGYDTLGDIYNQGDKEKAYQIFVETGLSIQKFSLQAANYERVFGGFKSRNMDRIMNRNNTRIRIPTGIEPLDEIMDGGIETGEFTLFLAESGKGKSTLLNGIGTTAARYGFNVDHEQAEGTKEQCLNRYDANWTGSLYKEIKKGEIPEHNLKKIYKVIKDISGEIFVHSHEKFGTRSMADVRFSLMEILKEYPVHVLILDYLELFEPGDGRKYSPSEERHRQQAIARACKNIAMEFNIAVVAATQASSIKSEFLNDPDFVINREHLSEDKGKVRPVDNFITINQTRDEYKLKTCRLFCDKLREHESNQVIPIAQNLARARFYDRKRTFEIFLNEEVEDEN